MRTGIEGVAFDLDGTLYPNYSLHIRLIPYLLKEMRLVAAFGKARTIIRRKQEISPIPQNDFYVNQVAETAKLLFNKKSAANTEALKEKINREIYRGWEQPFKKIKPFNGVKETLAALRKAGYKLGLLSDFPPEAKLEYLGLGGLWDAVLCSEQCGALKPYPSSFNELAATMSLPCEKILYVGNSHPYDVTGAFRAGMKTAWIKPRLIPAGKKAPAADFIFDNYRQLHDYMIN